MQVVSETYDDERYIIIAGLVGSYQLESLINDCLGNLTQGHIQVSQLLCSLSYILLRVTPVNSIGRQDEQIVTL